MARWKGDPPQQKKNRTEKGHFKRVSFYRYLPLFSCVFFVCWVWTQKLSNCEVMVVWPSPCFCNGLCASRIFQRPGNVFFNILCCWYLNRRSPNMKRHLTGGNAAKPWHLTFREWSWLVQVHSGILINNPLQNFANHQPFWLLQVKVARIRF